MTSGWTQRIAPGEDGYPRRLGDVRGVQPTLHVAGTLRESSPTVAIVGSRAAASDAMAMAGRLARHVAARGGVVVSGGALGIDTAAHQGALAGGGPTTVVLGTGLDVLYPERNAPLFAAVVAAGGALVSMFPPGSGPRAGHFVRRNALVAALADAVVVVAATGTSGSLHTAGHARRFGRALAAVPGTAGTRALLSAGAAAVTSPDDLDRVLAGAPPATVRPPLAGEHARAHAALDPRLPRDAGDVADQLGLSLARAMSLLSDLEATGWAFAVPGSAYVRAP